VAKPYPQEFRDDVVAVARQGQASLKQIAKDFGISEGSLANWMKQADIEDGRRPGLSDAVIALKGDSYRLMNRELGRVPAAATEEN